MEDDRKTKEQLLVELAEARQRIAELEAHGVEPGRGLSAAEVEAALRALPDLFFRVGPDFIILDYRVGRLTDLPLPPEPILGKRTRDVLPVKVARLLERATLKALKDRAMVPLEFTLELPQGEQIYEARVVPLREDQAVQVIRNVTDRRRAEEALKAANRSLQIYARLVESSPDRISVVDRHHVFCMVNPTYARMQGRPASDFVGHPVAEFFRREEYESLIRPNLDRCFAGESVHYQAWFTYPVPGRRYMDARYYPLVERGRVDYAVLQIRDVTEAHLAEEQLRENEERFRLIVDNSPDTIYHQDRDLRYIWIFNPVSPLTEARVLGKTDFDLFSPEDAERLKEIKRKVLETGVGDRVEEHLIVDGIEHWLEVALQPRRDQRGEIVGLWGYCRDITNRKRAEEALRESQERYRNLVETTSDWVWEVDVDTVYSYVSPRVRDLLGYSPEELLGRTPFDLMPPEEAQRVEEGFWPTLAEREPFRFLENANRHSDGHLVVLETSAIPVFDEAGKFYGYRGIDRDITERKQVERLREEYLSLISHDLRAPLAVIMGQADWLRRLLEKRGLERETGSAESILKGARRMNSMIQDLVESARLEAGRMEMRKELVNLPELASEVIQRVGTLQERARLQLEPLEWVPPVPADPERIERVLMNLITNALKYSPADRPVMIRVRHRDGEALVSVTDQGLGILPEDMPFLFERFFRAKTGKKAEGLGLGLYISRLIVEAHGGRIWAESQVGKGSTFFFTLPMEEIPQRP